MDLQRHKLVIGIISAPKNVEIREAIRQTWARNLKTLGIDYFFVIGSNEVNSVKIENDVLTLPLNDCYENLPKKVTLFFDYIYVNTDYNYVYKIDDDCYLNTNNLSQTRFWEYDYLGRPVGFLPEDLSPKWHFGKCSDPELNKTPFIREYEGSWCGGGYGYFLNRKALQILTQSKESLYDSKFSGPGYEDVGVGYILRHNNILPLGNEDYSCLNPMEYNINRDVDEQLFINLIEVTIGKKLFNYLVIMELKKAESFLYLDNIFNSPDNFYQKTEKEKDEIINKLERERAQLLLQIGEREKETSRLIKELTEKREEIIREVDYIRHENHRLQGSMQWFMVNYENNKLHRIVKHRVLKKLKIKTPANTLPKINNDIQPLNSKASKIDREPEITEIDRRDFTKKIAEVDLNSKSNKVYSPETILCTVVNHNCNENASKLSKNFSKYVNTIVIDSGSKIKDSSFINLENVYYSGLFNHACQYAKERNYEYIFFICSDVVIEESQVAIIFNNLKKIDFSLLGMYSPSSSGRSHFYCKRRNENGFRIVPFMEGFIFLASMEIMAKIAPIDTIINRLGWGIDVISGYYCKSMFKLSIVDDGANVFHPAETGYSNDNAGAQMAKWIKQLHNPALKSFTDKQIEVIMKDVHKSVNEHFKVSIIITAYNQLKELNLALVSLFMQEYSNYEILIIDTGSIDNTEEVVKGLAAKYSQLRYYKQENKNKAAARNAGLQNSAGMFIQFLDAIDLLSPDKLSNQIRDFLNNESLDISYSDYTHFEENYNEMPQHKVILDSDPAMDIIEKWGDNFSIPIHCFLYKRTSIEGIYFDPSLSDNADWDFHLRVAARKLNYMHSNQGIAYCRTKKDSVVTPTEEILSDERKCIENILKSSLYRNPHLSKLQKRLAEIH